MDGAYYTSSQAVNKHQPGAAYTAHSTQGTIPWMASTSSKSCFAVLVLHYSFRKGLYLGALSIPLLN